MGSMLFAAQQSLLLKFEQLGKSQDFIQSATKKSKQFKKCSDPKLFNLAVLLDFRLIKDQFKPDTKFLLLNFLSFFIITHHS